MKQYMEIGEKINFLTLVEVLGYKKQRLMGKFLCDCGGEKITQIRSVKTEVCKSCGCQRCKDRRINCHEKEMGRFP